MEMYSETDENRRYQRIVFANLEQDRHMLSDRFDRLYDDACYKQVKTGHEDVDWVLLEKKLSKIPRFTHRYYRVRTNKTDGLNRKGNADNRQSYVYRQIFLVKQHVTPGARTTGENEYHIFQTYSVPLMIYLQISGPRAPEGSFYANTRKQYRAYLLHPSKAYWIGPGTTYISMSLQKTCYAVLRVTTSALQGLQTQYTIDDAFQEGNLFFQKSQIELEQMVAQRVKRKRGRPTKSLDQLYWYKQQPQPQQPQPQQQQQQQQQPQQEESYEPKRAKEAEEQKEEEDIPLVPLPEIDENFIQALVSTDPKDIDNYLGPDLMNWLESCAVNYSEPVLENE